MGRTLPSITNAFLHEQQSLTRFRRALRRTDQRALDDLFAASRHHLAAAAYASHLLPFEIMLLSMLVEEHKQVLHLQLELERLHLLLGLEGDPAASPHMSADPSDSEIEDPQETLSLLPDRRALHEAFPSSYLPLPRATVPSRSREQPGDSEGETRAGAPSEQGVEGNDRASHPEGDRASSRLRTPEGHPIGDPEGDPPLRKRKWWAGG